jgi:DNA (cytosine-5)-methyltransferase 1
MEQRKIEHTIVDIDSIETHPKNVRQGDIGAISESLKAHGQYRPIVVDKRTNRILAGNHTWKAAKSLGWTQITAGFIETKDDDEALRILLADNRTTDLASYDDSGLAELLKELAETDEGLIGTAFDGDGSPPCSTFSMAGNREKDWGKKKYFKEGQQEQVLDDLFFDFIDLGNKLQPKVIVAENVKGLISGNAKGYCKLIFEQLKQAGYKPQMFLINAAFCNVPQARERVFIIAQRNDLNKPLLQIVTNNKTISAQQSFNSLDETKVVKHYLSGRTKQLWHLTKQGKSFANSCKKLNGKSSWFNSRVIHPDLPAPTITAACNAYHWEEPRRLTENEYKRLATFPDDYYFYNYQMASYLTGMSVPPKMMQLIAEAIRDQWLND